MLLMTNSFYGREDRGLTDKLIKELPSILNWSLEGWATLKRVGHFEQPASAQQAMQQPEDLSSPIGAFLRERCEVGAAFNANVNDVFTAWTEWCTGQRRDHPGTASTFGRDLSAAVAGLRTMQKGPRGEQVRVYQGLRLKQQEW
jgi:putative DNA primase/helicase